MIEIVSRQRGSFTEKTLFFVIQCQKTVDKNVVLKICERKVTHRKRQGLKVNDDNLFLSKSQYTKVFLIQKNSANKICEV